MVETSRREFLKAMLYAGAALGLSSCLPMPIKDYFGEEKESLEEVVCEGKEKLKVGIFIAYTPREEQEGLASKITDCINKNSLDVFLGPEWLFVPHNRLYSRQEKEEIITKISEATKEKDTLIIPGSIMWYDKVSFYNTAPVISGGKLLGEYNKRLDGGTTELAAQRNWIFGSAELGNKDGIYQWRKYRVGVEICADHGLLKKSLVEQKQPMLDLYLLSSCGILIYASTLPIRDGGYGLCSDGMLRKAQVYRKEEQMLGLKQKYHKTPATKAAGPNLRIYEICL